MFFLYLLNIVGNFDILTAKCQLQLNGQISFLMKIIRFIRRKGEGGGEDKSRSHAKQRVSKQSISLKKLVRCWHRSFNSFEMILICTSMNNFDYRAKHVMYKFIYKMQDQWIWNRWTQLRCVESNLILDLTLLRELITTKLLDQVNEIKRRFPAVIKGENCHW